MKKTNTKGSQFDLTRFFQFSQEPGRIFRKYLGIFKRTKII